MSVCVYYGGKALIALSATVFSLGWTHSVEKFGWSETWRVDKGQLVEEQVKVQGSGAGIDPADNAKLIGKWYVWKPEPELRVPELNLAVSGFTPSAWKLCKLDQAKKPECYELDLQHARSEIEHPDSEGKHLDLPPGSFDNVKVVPGQCQSEPDQSPASSARMSSSNTDHSNH